ncbi:MAG: hypothetical protein JNL54_08590 [Kineosporiaceae bacterium]|nr:hypothetical protein [Kineosporiaceae bacterium]
MTTCTVLLGAADVVPRCVRDVLRDWSASGLVEDLIWIDEADVDPTVPFALVPSDLIVRGQVTRAGVQDHLANLSRLEGARICVVSALGATSRTADPGVAAHVRNGLRSGLPYPESAAAHIVITRHGAGGWDPSVAWLGWQTIVVAPEDAWTPGRSTVAAQVTTTTPTAEFAAHGAAALASLCGLWRGAPASVLDGQGQQRSVHLARPFVRILDAGPVARALLHELTDFSPGLPRPSVADQGQTLPVLSDPVRASRAMRDAVVGLHPDLFTLNLEQPPAATRDTASAWQLLTSFFGFLWAALRRAPQQWLDRQKDRVKGGLARKVERVVFGQGDAPIQAVLGGVTSDGRRLSLDEQARQIEDLGNRVVQQGVGMERRRPHLGQFWVDVARGAMTLADGENRLGDGQQLAGVERGIVQWPEHVAPDPSDIFPIPGALHDADLADIASYDVVGARTAREQLAWLAANSQHHAQLAGQELQKLDNWFEGSSRYSPRHAYTSQIGIHIGRHLDHARGELRRLLEELRAAAQASEALPAQVTRSASSLGRLLRWATGIGAGVALLLSVLGLVKWGWMVALGLGLATVLMLLIAGLLTWRRARQAEFALLFRREQEERIEVLRRNIVRAADHLHQLMGLYAQYLAWAAILGRFLAEPFGRPGAERDDGMSLRGMFPRAMGLGVARPAADQLRAAGDHLRPALFRPGWLDPYWARLLELAAEQASRDSRGRVSPKDLFADPARSPDSIVRTLAQRVTGQGVPPHLGAMLWERASRRMAADGVDHLVSTLFTEVDVLGHDHRPRFRGVPGTEFLTQLAVGAADSRRFDPAVLTGQAKIDELNAVVDSSVQRRDVADPAMSLDQMVVVVQLSAGIPPDGVTLAGGQQPTPPIDPRPGTQPGSDGEDRWSAVS